MKKKERKEYPHNLSKFTIVTDINSFEAYGIRYLVYMSPTTEEDGIVIDIQTAKRYPITLKKYLLYI